MKKKALLTSLGILTGTLIATDLLLGHYLLQYAVSRSSASSDRKLKKKYTKKEESFADITDEPSLQNIALEEALGKAWHESIPYETIYLTSYDNLKLYGEFYPQQISSGNYVILIHGYKMNGSSMYQFAYHYWQKGYHVLIVDLRACGHSEGTYLGMGWLDRRDILNWIQYLLSLDQNAKIVLHGISMGAATVMMTSGEEALPPNVKVCIEDSGYTSVHDIFQSELTLRFGLPGFPLLDTASLLSRRKAYYRFREASALKQVAKSHTPTLFIHGTDDEFVPFSMLEPLYKAAACEKEMYTVWGARHCCSVYHNVDRYYQTVFQFIERYL